MKNNEEKYLPIGSVVKLKGGKRRIMVTGYSVIDMVNKDKIFDYCGCLYPVGLIDSKHTLLFNHEDIEEISGIGYKDEEEEKFIKNLKEYLTDENIEKILEDVKKQNGDQK